MVNWKPLSRQEIESIENSIENIGCKSCIGGSGIGSIIGSLAPTCSVTSKTVGQIVHMSAKPTGGTAPYTVSFKKGTVLLKQFTGVAEIQSVAYDYTTLSTDVGITHIFSTSTTDSCSTGAKTCNEQCSITVNAVVSTCKDVICALITGTGTYYQAYKEFIGREPDCGDAEWLCSKGIDTEAKLAAYLGPTCTPNWQCELPLNGYEKDVNNCGSPRRLNSACSPGITCGTPICNLIIT